MSRLMRWSLPLTLAVFVAFPCSAAVKFFTDYPNTTPLDSDFFVLQRNQSYVNSTPTQVRTTWFTSPVFTGNGSISGSFTAGSFFGDGSGLTGIPSGSVMTNYVNSTSNSIYTSLLGSFISNNNGNGTNTSFWGSTSFQQLNVGTAYFTNAFWLHTNWYFIGLDINGQIFQADNPTNNDLAIGLGATNQATVVSNALWGFVSSQVRSIDIPMGAWFTNNVGDGASITAASASSITNAGDGWIFASGNSTNEIRTRFSLPWDWDGGTVKIGLYSLSSGTNSIFTTNIVWSVKSAALGGGNDVSNPTFGTAVWVTNNVNIGAWKQGTEAVTTALTVGNTPTTSKGILWSIQRLSKQSGDTETNTLYLAQMRVYYNAVKLQTFPTSSP